MKLVVLDVDGVLNSQDFLLVNRGAAPGSREQLDPLGCQRVQRICDATGAQILLSSTWRLSEKRPHMQEMLCSRGLNAKIVGYTPSLVEPMGRLVYRGVPRGEEIHRWLTQVHRGVTGLVVIDDDSDACHNNDGDPFLEPWYVQTYWDHGILDSDVDRAIRCLNQPVPEWLER